MVYQQHFVPGDGIEHSYHAVCAWEAANEVADAAYADRLEAAKQAIAKSFDECDLADVITPQVLAAVKAGRAQEAGALLVQSYRAFLLDAAELQA